MVPKGKLILYVLAVMLTWQPVDQAIRYNIYRAPQTVDANGDVTCGTFTKLGNTGGWWFKDTGTVPSCYQVSAILLNEDQVTVPGSTVESERSDVVVP